MEPAREQDGVFYVSAGGRHRAETTGTGEVDFEALANEHKDAIYRQMLRVCGNHEDAEDVLIEALLKAYCSMDQLRDSASFRAWLAQIARRVCWQLKEHEALLPLLQLSQLEEDGFDLRDKGAAPEEIAAAAQMRQLLRDAVARLAPESRAVYELRDIEELPGDEVAARLGISLRAMKSRLHRARSTLRQEMEIALVKPDQRKQ
ncbi:MAG TPA: RNA polymerase sigma factor [Acidobacteriaceae bacterium]